MRGLIAPLERKNGWTLAEEAWHAGPDRVHRLLNRIDWDADEILDDLREKVVEHLGGPEAVLIVDDTGFLKKRVRSAWVQRQWAQGKVDEITPIQYDAFRKYGQAKYSHNYANVILGIFKMLMDDAVLKYKYREESPIVEQKRRCLYKKKQVRRAKRQLSIRVRAPGGPERLLRLGIRWVDLHLDHRLHRTAAAELREEALQRYESLHALRVQRQTYRADGQAVLAAPKYDSWRTIVIPPFLHAMHKVLLASHDQPWVFLSMQGKPLLRSDFGNT